MVTSRKKGWRRLGLLIAGMLLMWGYGFAGLISPFNLPSSVATADLNNDGLLDIAVAVIFISGSPPHSGFVSVILQNPEAPGTFFRGAHYATGADPQALAVGDLNGDVNLDLAVANGSSKDISILMQDPSNPGQFLPQTRIHVGGYPSGIAIGDLDGDGRQDVAVATVASGISVLFQDPSAPPGSFLSPVAVSLRRAGALAIGDVNDDNVPDLVSVSDKGLVSVLLQDPEHRGTFPTGSDFRVRPQPIAVKIGDLNGDGLPDLAVANIGSPSNPNTANVSVLLQDPAHHGSFLRRIKYRTGARSTDVAIGDLNGDDRPDLITANSGRLGTTGSVSVLLQTPPKGGKLAFSRKNYAGKRGPSSVAIGDLNGDGKPDIAVADGDSAAVLLQKKEVPVDFSYGSIRKRDDG